MVSSILTNSGALTALQSLKSTQKSLLNTQSRISTGLKVATAKDNAATWAVATSMRSDIANTKQVSENLSVSSSIVATASAASESIADLVKQVRVLVTSAQNPAVDKKQVQASIDGYLAQIDSTVNAASFKGVNLLSDSGSQRVLTSVNTNSDGISTGAYTDIAKQNMGTEKGALLEGLKDLTVLSRADQTFSALNDGVQKVNLAAVGTGTLAINAGNNIEVKYIDENNTDRTLTVKVDKNITQVKDMLSYLNADAGFSAKFTADASVIDGVTSATGFQISAKNRDSTIKLGSNSGTTTVSTAGVFNVTAGTGGLDVAALGAATTGLAGGAQALEVTFADKALQVGDEFVLQVQEDPATLPGSATGPATFKLQVVDGTAKTGDIIQNGSDTNSRTFVIAVAAADVTNPNITGKEIATKMMEALTTATSNAAATGKWTTGGSSFTATPTATSYGVSVDTSTGGLRILSNSNADAVTSFTSSKTDYDVLLSKVDTATKNVTNAAAAFGTAATRIDLQKDFLDKLTDTLTTGLGALVDADMSEEAARLQALQVQEQLGTQALSIANQAPQSILRLFQ